MPYVQRDVSNAIIGVYASKQPGYAEQFLSADDPEVVSYLTPNPDGLKKAEVAKISSDMISSGVFEVFALVAKQVYFDKVKALPQASGLTDEQIHQALINPVSPYYNLTYARVHEYSNRLEEVD